MPPRRCCCAISCELGSDSFDRANANPPSGSWHVVSGEFEILGNTLNTVTPGVLATTTCHPAAYAIGSYVAEVTLIGMSDGSVSLWKVYIGDPASPPFRVEVSHNSGTNVAVLSLFNTVGLIHAETYSGVTTNAVLRICWAPDMMASAFLGGRIPHIDHCISVIGSNCYTSGMTNVGGFSFGDGRFDNWKYDVHFIENANCEACSCFCYRTYLDGEGVLVKDYSCIPATVTLTFESVGADAATMPDMTLTQSFGTPATPWPDKQGEWNSGIYNCGSPVGAEFAFRFECGRPIDQMSLTPLSASYGVELGGQVVWSWLTGASPTNSGRSGIIASSTCSPLSIVFPEIKINSADPGPICGMDGGFQPYCSNLNETCFATEPDIRFIPRIIV